MKDELTIAAGQCASNFGGSELFLQHSRGLVKDLERGKFESAEDQIIKMKTWLLSLKDIELGKKIIKKSELGIKEARWRVETPRDPRHPPVPFESLDIRDELVDLNDELLGRISARITGCALSHLGREFFFF